MKGYLPNLTERHREDLVRRSTVCPLCGALPGRTCRGTYMAHTARYLLAAELGVVPPLPGGEDA